MYEYMYEWMDGWMQTCMYTCAYLSIYLVNYVHIRFSVYLLVYPCMCHFFQVLQIFVVIRIF